MNESSSRRRRARIFGRGAVAVAVLAVGLFAFGPGTAGAAVPTNDNFANATAINPGSLPFSEAVDITDATLEAGEPSGCYIAGKSIWYSITPTADGTVRADIGNSNFFDRILYVYRQDGAGLGGLSTIACASPYYNGLSSATFHVSAGTTYYIQVGGFFSYSSGTLNLSVQEILPPANDDFANATSIGGVPFNDDLDTTVATAQPGDPTPSCGFSPQWSVWYRFDPPAAGSYTANVTSSGGFGFAVEYGAYTGSALGSLSETACHLGNPFTFHAAAGLPVYIQVASSAGPGQPMRFTLDVAPSPIAQIALSIADPTIFDTMQFYDQSYDPGGLGFSSETWNFGDGSTATGCCPSHRYGSDGDYTVKLTVGTPDGRSASTSQGIHVRTHDVAISKLTVPQSAAAGQTRSITVGVANSRYPESVQVQLYRNDAVVGTLTQQVPVRGANRTTPFSFNYTFTSDDAALGKVTFKAVATISGARDALPSDNTAIALPTKVTR
jgi:PKD repeat protein